MLLLFSVTFHFSLVLVPGASVAITWNLSPCFVTLQSSPMCDVASPNRHLRQTGVHIIMLCDRSQSITQEVVISSN